jgi:N-acetylmuramoyl-L-alanine amidase
MLIPSNNKFLRPGTKMVPQYIVVHETDNTDKGANARAHAMYLYNGNDRQASWHYSVDSGETVYQSIPDNETSWNAGDGRGAGNMSGIAVEMCVNSDGDFEKTKENAVALIKELMLKHHITKDRIVPHKYWSGKDCPKNVLKSGWEHFHDRF